MKIDKRVALPNSKTKPYVYPWHDLKVGDSFFIPNQHSPFNLVIAYNKKLPKYKQIKITRRLEGDGQRIWRVK